MTFRIHHNRERDFKVERLSQHTVARREGNRSAYSIAPTRDSRSGRWEPGVEAICDYIMQGSAHLRPNLDLDHAVESGVGRGGGAGNLSEPDCRR